MERAQDLASHVGVVRAHVSEAGGWQKVWPPTWEPPSEWTFPKVGVLVCNGDSADDSAPEGIVMLWSYCMVKKYNSNIYLEYLFFCRY